MTKGFFITGTDTHVGKTALSALLCAALPGTYWKPIQTGASEGTDRQAVKFWAEMEDDELLPENLDSIAALARFIDKKTKANAQRCN